MRLSRLLRGEKDSALSTTPNQLQAAKNPEDEGGKEQRSQLDACSGSEVLSQPQELPPIPLTHRHFWPNQCPTR